MSEDSDTPRRHRHFQHLLMNNAAVSEFNREFRFVLLDEHLGRHHDFTDARQFVWLTCSLGDVPVQVPGRSIAQQRANMQIGLTKTTPEQRSLKRTRRPRLHAAEPSALHKDAWQMVTSQCRSASMGGSRMSLWAAQEDLPSSFSTVG